MKMKKFLASAFALTMLTSCGGSVKPEKFMEAFETEVKGTAQLTFTSKYVTDVISEKGGMDGFKHNVDDKVVADLDLTEGDLYLYVKNDANDKGVAKTREALLYKDGSSYKYVTSVMENPLTLKDEASARAKIDELLNKISNTFTGSVDTKSLVFSKGGAYEHKEFGLSTSNIAAEDFIGTPEFKTSKTELEVKGTLDYIGYHTDAGISDFPGVDGKPAADYTIKTNNKGYVTSYVENMDASLAMPIMNPAPIVTIKGTKNLSATYGETFVKKATIAHELTKTTLAITSTTYGKVEAFVTPTIDGNKTPVADKASLTVGQFLAVKVTPAGKNTIKMVTFAGSSKETPEADGYFYFEIPEGKANLTVNFVGSDVIDTVKYATFNHSVVTGITVSKVEWFTLAGGQPDAMKPVVNGKVPFGKDNWIAYTVVAPEGKQIKATCDGGNITFLMGSWCVNAKEEKLYNVHFEIAEPVVTPTYDASIVPNNNNFGLFSGLELNMCKPKDFLNMTVLGPTDSKKLVAGNWLCIKVKPGYEFTSMTLNGKNCMIPPAQAGGYYCFTIEKGVNTLDGTFTKVQ